MCPCLYPGYKQLKDTGHRHTMHNSCTSNPSIKITCNIYTHCVRSPDSKKSTFHSFNLHWMSAQLLICLIINTCAESLLLFLCDLAWKSIGIITFCLCLSHFYKKSVFRHLAYRKQYCKISGLVLFLADISFLSADHIYFLCIRKKSLNKNSVLCDPWSHHISGSSFLSIHNSFNPRPVHIAVYFFVHSCVTSPIVRNTMIGYPYRQRIYGTLNVTCKQ